MSAFSLSSVVSSATLWAPPRILIYGEHGLGKTTMGCSFEKPILLRIEDGIGKLDVPTFPSLPRDYNDVLAAFQALHDEEHDFKTLVLDSLDWLEEKHVIPYACAVQGVQGIEEIPYGKGWAMVDNSWMAILGWLDALRSNRGMTIVTVAHADVKRYDPPDGEPYDRYQIKLQKRSNRMLQEWHDMVHHIKMRITKATASKDVKQSAYKATSSGERVVVSEWRPAQQSKNRFDLPLEINIGRDKTFAAYHQTLHAATNGRYALPSTLQQAPPTDAA